MITTREAFDKLKKRLELSDTEKKDAQRREQEVREQIAKDFQVDRDFLSGSYGRHTKAKPLKDVDVVFELGKDERWRRDKPPIEMLQAFETSLRKKYGKDQVNIGRRCVTVEFEKTMYQDGTEEKVLSIDAVPAFKLGHDYEIPDKDKGQWIKTNPETHKRKATDKNVQLDDKWKPLVKMVKAWNRDNGKSIKPSFLIEVMALDLVQPAFSDYPNEIRNFFAAAADGIGRQWPDPAGLGPPVSDQMTPELVAKARTALNEAQSKATLAFRAEQTGRQGDALQLWQEILGPLFAKS
ncbi:MAG: hypothetical protein NVS9B15_23420 [Acidobacteriaceae bacterium]